MIALASLIAAPRSRRLVFYFKDLFRINYTASVIIKQGPKVPARGGTQGLLFQPGVEPRCSKSAGRNPGSRIGKTEQECHRYDLKILS